MRENVSYGQASGRVARSHQQMWVSEGKNGCRSTVAGTSLSKVLIGCVCNLQKGRMLSSNERTPYQDPIKFLMRGSHSEYSQKSSLLPMVEIAKPNLWHREGSFGGSGQTTRDKPRTKARFWSFYTLWGRYPKDVQRILIRAMVWFNHIYVLANLSGGFGHGLE